MKGEGGTRYGCWRKQQSMSLQPLPRRPAQRQQPDPQPSPQMNARWPHLVVAHVVEQVQLLEGACTLEQLLHCTARVDGAAHILQGQRLQGGLGAQHLQEVEGRGAESSALAWYVGTALSRLGAPGDVPSMHGCAPSPSEHPAHAQTTTCPSRPPACVCAPHLAARAHALLPQGIVRQVQQPQLGLDQCSADGAQRVQRLVLGAAWRLSWLVGLVDWFVGQLGGSVLSLRSGLC